ncbi:MAG: UvrD-helicase domain-containing protein [Candidatus Pacebacteria bacterium]|nr:UvrD-helicase domain-containing protein [Candidatus Paceibacterota bacterium]
MDKTAGELNQKQKEATETLDGPLLILAGAGAGKTKTIVHRILNLIKSGVHPHSILAITFTNKAAKEMRNRVDGLLESDKSLNLPISMRERPFVSTFHALGVHIIRENATLIGLTRYFSIYDRTDSKKAVKDALEQLGLNNETNDPANILSAISRAKGDGYSIESYRNKSGNDFRSRIVSSVWEKYDAALLREKALDFDDLLLKTMLILKGNPAVRERYAQIWTHIHVDEYQDTNGVQYEIVRLLVGANKNLCVVGDIDQNIYSWRGATIENILNFEKDYPESKVIILEENYRSTKNILTAANNIIKKNSMRREKNLFTKNGDGEKIRVTASYTETDEARDIADECKDLIKKGTHPREIAVLYRANFQSRVLEESFLRKEVPYQVLGVRFFERKEVKDVLSFIRASINRESSADLVRIINVPPRGIGKATMMKVLAHDETGLSKAMSAKISDFMSMLDEIRDIALTKKPSELVRFVLTRTGIESAARKNAEEEEKLENMRELATVARTYDDLPIGEAVESLLSNAALATDQDELKEDKDAVRLMTVHASKGLEFDYVFIAGLEQELFPHERMGKEELTQGQEEEERRLFYVALTRARKKVFLSWAQIRTVYGSQRINSPSEFIADIGDELIEEEAEVKEERPNRAKMIFMDF